MWARAWRAGKRGQAPLLSSGREGNGWLPHAPPTLFCSLHGVCSVCWVCLKVFSGVLCCLCAVCGCVACCVAGEVPLSLASTCLPPSSSHSSLALGGYYSGFSVFQGVFRDFALPVCWCCMLCCWKNAVLCVYPSPLPASPSSSHSSLALGGYYSGFGVFGVNKTAVLRSLVLCW